jgi:hypothetical protein
MKELPGRRKRRECLDCQSSRSSCDTEDGKYRHRGIRHVLRLHAHMLHIDLNDEQVLE